MDLLGYVETSGPLLFGWLQYLMERLWALLRAGRFEGFFANWWKIALLLSVGCFLMDQTLYYARYGNKSLVVKLYRACRKGVLWAYQQLQVLLARVHAREAQGAQEVCEPIDEWPEAETEALYDEPQWDVPGEDYPETELAQWESDETSAAEPVTRAVLEAPDPPTDAPMRRTTEGTNEYGPL